MIFSIFAEYAVTPFVGVWIETMHLPYVILLTVVTPFVGVWIETKITTSLPYISYVTPFVGVWIETRSKSHNQ